jgi:hypothetical protein
MSQPPFQFLETNFRVDARYISSPNSKCFPQNLNEDLRFPILRHTPPKGCVVLVEGLLGPVHRQSPSICDHWKPC